MRKNYKFETIKGLAWYSALHTSGSILVPLLIFGGIGYLLDKGMETKPLFLLGGVGLAFIITNILIYRKVMLLTKYFDIKSSKKDK